MGVRTGVEVPAETLPTVPSRTWPCNFRDFMRLRAAAQSPHRSACCLPMLSPVSLPASIWFGITNCLDLTYTAFVVAFSLAFNTTQGFEAGWLGITDIIGSIIYMADLFMGFHMGVVASWEGRAVIVQDARVAMEFYTKHGTFWADLVATLPLFAQIGIAAAGNDTSAVRIIYMLRLLRLIRVARLLSGLSRSSVGGPLQFVAAALTTRTLLLIHALFTLCVLVNLLGSIWWYVAALEGLENSWAAAITKDYDLLTATDPQRWLVSCYFALTTMVTIGYGDITPTTIKETGVTILFEVVGVGFFGYLLNVVTTLIAATGPAAKRAEAVRQKLEDVEDAMAHVQLSHQLQRHIRHYFNTSWGPPPSVRTHQDLFRELPIKLRDRLMAQHARPRLEEVGFFPPGMHHRQMKACCALVGSAATPVVLLAGQPLAAGLPEVEGAGDGAAPGGTPFLFLLNEGRMSMAAQADGAGGIFVAPAVLGLAELFAADPAMQPAVADGSLPSWHQAGAVALTTCNLVRLDCSQLYLLLRSQQPALLLHLAGKVLGWLEGGARGTPGTSFKQAPAPGPQQDGQQHEGGAARELLRQLVAALTAQVQAEAKPADSGKSLLHLGRRSQHLSSATSKESGMQLDTDDGELVGVDEGPLLQANPVGLVWHRE